MAVELSSQSGAALLGNVLNLMQDVTPRDMDALRTLKQHHLVLLEVKITPVSTALGMQPAKLPLPPRTLLLSMLRNGEALAPDQFLPLQAGDELILLAGIRHEAYIRQALTAPAPILIGDEAAVESAL